MSSPASQDREYLTFQLSKKAEELPLQSMFKKYLYRIGHAAAPLLTNELTKPTDEELKGATIVFLPYPDLKFYAAQERIKIDEMHRYFVVRGDYERVVIPFGLANQPPNPFKLSPEEERLAAVNPPDMPFGSNTARSNEAQRAAHAERFVKSQRARTEAGAANPDDYAPFSAENRRRLNDVHRDANGIPDNFSL